MIMGFGLFYLHAWLFRALWSEGEFCERVGNYQFLNAFFPPNGILGLQIVNLCADYSFASVQKIYNKN